jgi:hypothetical protein
MKHITAYKLFEDTSKDLKKDIEDILIDFSDKYIPILVTISPFKNKTICSIAFGINGQEDILGISISDSKEDLLRLYDYMVSEGYEFSPFSHVLQFNNLSYEFYEKYFNKANFLFF